MGGIRELALTPEDETPKEKTIPMFSNEDYAPSYKRKTDYSETGWDSDYSEYMGDKKPKKKEKKINSIEIRMNISDKEIGMDYYDLNYDIDEAEKKAKEIAYDKLVARIGKDFESKNITTMKAETSYEGGIDVKIFLIPDNTTLI